MPTIRPVDPADPRAVEEYLAPYVAVERANDPDRPLYSAQDTVGVLRTQGRGWRYHAFTAYEGEVPVGSAMHVVSLADNTDVLRVLVWVAPAAWGSGVGDALVQHAEARARELGRSLVEGEGTVHGRAGAATSAFARRHGYRQVMTMVERVLRLPAPLPPCPDPDDGYTLRVVRGAIPADLAQGYCDVHNRLNLDAPQGDREVEATRRTPAVLAGQDAEIVAQGRERLTVVALAPDGAVAGFTSGVVDQTGATYDQWATIVEPAHRGHRLGLRIKTEQTCALTREWPGLREVRTSNEESNRHMVAVNEALGYAVCGAEGVFQKRLRHGQGAPAGATWGGR